MAWLRIVAWVAWACVSVIAVCMFTVTRVAKDKEPPVVVLLMQRYGACVLVSMLGIGLIKFIVWLWAG